MSPNQKQPLFENRYGAPAQDLFFLKHDSQINLAGINHPLQIAREAFHHMQTDITVAFLHGVDKRHSENGSGTGSHADADVPGKSGLACG